MFWLLFALACSDDDTTTTTTDETGTTTAADCEAVEPSVVDLTTRDGVSLVGDLYTAGGADRPGFVLLHMIPPSYDRTGWTRSFIDRLSAACWNAIAIDRRGAGESGGTARDAYTGEYGRYDVEAAVKRLQDEGLASLAVIGASNGTTSMIDYSVWAAGEGLPEVAALGFMTGGTYTEAQTAMGDVPKVPAIFTYSTGERDWSVNQQPLDPGTWSFQEYAEGDHGTKMFSAAPEVEEDLEGFFAGVL